MIAEQPERTNFWLLQANAGSVSDGPSTRPRTSSSSNRLGSHGGQRADTGRHLRQREPVGPRARAYGRALEIDPPQTAERALRNVEVLAQRGALARPAPC